MRSQLMCRACGDDVSQRRWELGYRLCLLCGEDAARAERAGWTVVQQYGKGPYQLVTQGAVSEVLRSTNQKEVRV
jgi:hypothetical protein